MKCWRDLGKDCVESSCPMWLKNIDFSDFSDKDELGLNDSRCVLVIREKMGVFQQMMDLAESMDFLPGSLDEDFFDLFEKASKKPARPKLPAGQKKKTTKAPIQEKPRETGKQMPLR